MKSIILCEGKTDGIILSYYLEKCYSWKFEKDIYKGSGINKFPKFPLKENETINWYSNNEKYLSIFSCGGISNIENKLMSISEINASQDINKKFSKIVIMIDHDTKTEVKLKEEIEKWLENSNIILDEPVKIGEWNKGKIKTLQTNREDSFEIEMLIIVIPEKENGNLEVFLLNALKEVEEDKKLVDESNKYITALKDVSYLSKGKYKYKAQLQAVLSVISPEWVFTEIHQRMQRVSWEKLSSINNVYQNFNKL